VTNGAGVVTVAPAYTIGLATGAYAIVASFAGDLDYLPTSGNGTLTVTHEDATLAYTGDTVSNGGAFVLSATITQAADGGLGDITLAGTVEFRLYYKAGPGAGTLAATHSGAVNGLGVVTVNLGTLASRSYDVEIELLANNYYTAPQIAAVIQTTPVIAVDDRAGQYSDSVSLGATITADTIGLAGETLSFTVNGLFVATAVTNGSGVATLPYLIDLPAGSYPILVEFANNGTYTASSGAGTLTVTQEDATLAYTGPTTIPSGAPSSLALSATVTQAADGSLGTFAPPAVSLQFVVRTLGGAIVDTKIAVVSVGGTASVASIALTSQPYTVEVSMVANGYYVATPVITTVKANPTLLTANGAVQYSDQTTVSATLSDGVGGISGKTVSFTVNGVAIGSGVTNGAGVATVTWTNVGAAEVPAGSYDLVATFTGDADYEATSDTKTMTVSKESATPTYSGDTQITGASFNLAATVVQQSDGLLGDITKAVVRWTVTRISTSVAVTHTGAVDGAGNALNNIALAAGGYTILTEIDPANEWFTGTGNTVTVKAQTALALSAPASVQYSDVRNLVATLTHNGVGVGGKTVAFLVDGVSVGTAVTDGAGVATLAWTATLQSGTYTLDASFNGTADDDYNSSNAAQQSVTVTKEDLTLAYTGPTEMPTSASNQAITLSASLTQNDVALGNLNLATVSFTVYQAANGGDPEVLIGTFTATSTSGTVAVGSASTVVNLDNWGYRVVSQVPAGNTYYTSNSVESFIKGRPHIVADDTSGGQFSDQATIRATLTVGPGGAALVGKTVSFYRVSDNLLLGTGVTNASGLAQATITIGTGTVGTNSNWFRAEYNPAGADADLWINVSDLGDLAITKESLQIVSISSTQSGNEGNLQYAINLREAQDGFYANPGITVPLRIQFRKASTQVWTVCIDTSVTFTQATSWGFNQASTGCGGVTGSDWDRMEVHVGTNSVYETTTWLYQWSKSGGTVTLTLLSETVTASGGGSSSSSTETTMSTSDSSGSFGETTTLEANVGGSAAFDAQPILLASAYSDLGFSMTRLANSLSGGGVSQRVPLTLIGQSIYFYIEGKYVGSAPVLADGSARLQYKVDLPAGQYRIEASFRGHLSHRPATATGTLTVAARTATVTYTGDTLVSRSNPVLRAKLNVDPGSVSTGSQISFTVRNKATGLIVGRVNVPLMGDGTASRTISPLPAGEYTITVGVVPDGYFNESFATGTLTVLPTSR